ncbi:hypothetical protein EDD21DRAFT_122011 [Dissophora ornata]|nr:hypothetical protein EDD21DRAFT_122011 [Dissophora ornata]
MRAWATSGHRGQRSLAEFPACLAFQFRFILGLLLTLRLLFSSCRCHIAPSPHQHFLIFLFLLLLPHLASPLLISSTPVPFALSAPCDLFDKSAPTNAPVATV